MANERHEAEDLSYGVYRASYTEEDVDALLADPRFLVGVDAYQGGCCTLSQMLLLVFDGPPYIPRQLDPMVFARLVFDICDRICSGELKVPEESKQTYSRFYIVQPEPAD